MNIHDASWDEWAKSGKLPEGNADPLNNLMKAIFGEPRRGPIPISKEGSQMIDDILNGNVGFYGKAFSNRPAIYSF